jgi:formiminotetrahydrofolate cyclodeaminase
MSESSYSAMGVASLLDAFASHDPVPGGGAAAALTGALGVSLLLMVAGMAKTRNGTPEETADLAEAAARLRPLREELIELIARDPQAYQQVIAALRLPKSTEAEQRRRRDAIEAATRLATEAPLETMRACEEALRDAPLIARAGNPNAVTDAAAGVTLLVAALRVAGMNVDVNVKGLTGEDYVTAATAERQQLERAAVATATSLQAVPD